MVKKFGIEDFDKQNEEIRKRHKQVGTPSFADRIRGMLPTRRKLGNRPKV